MDDLQIDDAKSFVHNRIDRALKAQLPTIPKTFAPAFSEASISHILEHDIISRDKNETGYSALVATSQKTLKKLDEKTDQAIEKLTEKYGSQAVNQFVKELSQECQMSNVSLEHHVNYTDFHSEDEAGILHKNILEQKTLKSPFLINKGKKADDYSTFHPQTTDSDFGFVYMSPLHKNVLSATATPHFRKGSFYIKNPDKTMFSRASIGLSLKTSSNQNTTEKHISAIYPHADAAWLAATLIDASNSEMPLNARDLSQLTLNEVRIPLEVSLQNAMVYHNDTLSPISADYSQNIDESRKNKDTGRDLS